MRSAREDRNLTPFCFKLNYGSLGANCVAAGKGVNGDRIAKALAVGSLGVTMDEFSGISCIRLASDVEKL